jgi:hypothetical protein
MGCSVSRKTTASWTLAFDLDRDMLQLWVYILIAMGYIVKEAQG